MQLKMKQKSQSLKRKEDINDKPRTKTIDKLYQLMSDIQKENNEFRKQINDLTAKMNTKVETKHLPITLEQDILSVTQQSIQKSNSRIYD